MHKCALSSGTLFKGIGEGNTKNNWLREVISFEMLYSGTAFARLVGLNKMRSQSFRTLRHPISAFAVNRESISSNLITIDVVI